MPRLDHLLARNLGCTRGAARELVLEQRVRGGDGTIIADPRSNIDEEHCPWAITIGGDPAVLHDVCHVILNKPVGHVTALKDDRHPTAYSLLKEAPLWDELRPVGRLDLDTTGLLLWTTDGQWLHRLTHPRYGVTRTYQAALARPWRQGADIKDITLDDGHRPNITDLHMIGASELHPALAPAPEAACWAAVTIRGGAYHEVRRIFAALGSHVLSLCRTAYGHLILPADLRPGGWRAIESGNGC